MKKGWTGLVALMMSVAVYAANDPAVDQGAADYDWQSCLDAKTNDCLNDCQNSEDIDCSDNCASMAADKCKSMGVVQPEGQ